MIGQNIPIALVVRGCIWLLLFGKIAAMYGGRRFDRIACILLLVSLLLAQSLLTVDYMTGITALLFLVARGPEQQTFTNTTLPLSLLAAVAFLTKTSIYAMLMMSVAAYWLFTYIEARNRPSRASMLRSACVVPNAIYRLSRVQPVTEGSVGIHRRRFGTWKWLQRGNVNLGLAAARLSPHSAANRADARFNRLFGLAQVDAVGACCMHCLGFLRRIKTRHRPRRWASCYCIRLCCDSVRNCHPELES